MTTHVGYFSKAYHARLWGSAVRCVVVLEVYVPINYKVKQEKPCWWWRVSVCGKCIVIESYSRLKSPQEWKLACPAIDEIDGRAEHTSV